MKAHTPNKLSRRDLLQGVSDSELAALVAGDCTDPHRILGAHEVVIRGESTTVVRAFHPDAERATCSVNGHTVELERVADGGVFAGPMERSGPLPPYRLCFHFPDGGTWELHDPYRFWPTVGDMDLHLFNEGTHRRLWRCLGARERSIDGIEGVSFAVWAPSARRVSVVGDFCGWDGRLLPMRQLGSSGVFELFVPGVRTGQLYKFEIKTREGVLRVKADPMAAAMEVPPGTNSRVFTSSYQWGDQDWITRRPERSPTSEPMSVYEVHLGSWARVPEEGNRSLTYREIAPRLIAHAKRFGFTHLELLPIAEHPFAGSWGYQVSAYYAPTARFGTPDDFRYFVDQCHQNGLGVILDWVPAHFPKDDFALRRFDGTALYEHEDPRLGEHPDWGTLVFNYGRNEVCCFLIANALYWFNEFHIDALRVDAVASLLYLDYSRKPGEWIPNRYGGRENLDAIDFLHALHTAIPEEAPGCFTIAEESTAWPLVTRPPSEGGLGFTLKWNMGWMHDTLVYFSKDPVHRHYHHDQLTFAMVYEYNEHFLMPLSHDEVVHGKRSLLEKMPGDHWQKFANLRLLMTYQFTRPGKKLLFMGTELAPYKEWNHEASLDWHLADDPVHEKFGRFMEDLGRLYREHSCLWALDPDPLGFNWIDCSDRENCVIAYWRCAERDGLIVVLNLTPVPRDNYRIGAPRPGRYRERLCSDDVRYGGSELETSQEVDTDAVPFHGYPDSLLLRLPPLGALVLEPTS